MEGTEVRHEQPSPLHAQHNPPVISARFTKAKIKSSTCAIQGEKPTSTGKKTNNKRFHGNSKDVHPVKLRTAFSRNKQLDSKGKRKKTGSDSDSDFDTPISLLKQKKRKGNAVSEGKGHAKNKKHGLGQKMAATKSKATKSAPALPTSNINPMVILLRTSPKVLYTTMQNLKQAQKEYVVSIGLGNLLNMKVDGSPTKIGHYVVRNFDPENMLLRVNNVDIHINRQVIHHLLGLSLGEVQINSLPFRPKEDTTYDDWKKQFENSPDIRPNGVKNAILASSDVDLMFKVNLFVLLCNTLGKSKSMGTIDESVLSRVTKDIDLSSIDWCSHVYDCLKDTRNSWNEYSRTSYYYGPIIFLTLLYLECVRCDDYMIEKSSPAICCWSVTQMRGREDLELKKGGLGMGEIEQLTLTPGLKCWQMGR